VDNWNVLCAIEMYCGQLEYIVCNYVCLQMAGFLRNSANFSFKASGIRVAELSVNVVELSINSVELSMNAVEFWFSKRFLFLSHVKHISAEFLFFWLVSSWLNMVAGAVAR
jgi:hypothetical protein